MTKSFQLLGKFQEFPFRPKNLINWDTSENRLVYSNQFTYTRSWHLTTSILFLEKFLYSFAVFANKSGYSAFKLRILQIRYMDEMCLALYIHLALGFILSLEWLYYKYGEEFVEYINRLMTFHPRHRRKSRNTNDITGILGCLVVISITAGSVLLSIIFGSGLLQPAIVTIFLQSIPHLITSPELKLVVTILVYTTQFLLLLYVLLQVASTVSIGFLFTLFTVRLHSNHLADIKYLLLYRQYSASVRQYQHLHVIHRIGGVANSVIVGIFMGIGFYLFIFSLMLSILGWRLLPLLFLPIPIIVIGFCFLQLFVALPMAPCVNNLSLLLLEEWKLHRYNFKHENALYVKKLWNSLPPLWICCEPVGPLDADRATKYLYSIFDNSITSLLLCKGILKTWELI